MTSYNELPYPIIAHSQTHPAHLATLARLHGLRPRPVSRCRVLEIGCAQGGNLIPVACEFAGSEFVGLDLSPRQIADGQAFVQSLGLGNIRLVAQDLLDWDGSLGEFDYIIAHGLYSWAPPAVREKLLAVCQRHLAPEGVAYISFNAHPGWKAQSMVRDLMLYHTRRMEDPLARAEAAREALADIVGALTEAAPNWDNVDFAHAYFYEDIARRIRDYDVSYVAHEFLEEHNQPIYLYEFAEQAQRCGLQYFANINFRNSLDMNLPEAVARLLAGCARNRIEREQYLDFLTNRSFHQALLCRAGRPAQFELSPQLLRELYIASPAAPEAPNKETARQTFVGADRSRYAVDHPLTAAAWLCLTDLWPGAATWDELMARACDRLGVGEPTPAEAQAVADNLIAAFLTSPRLIQLSVHNPTFARQIGERPVASPWARLQAERQETITTLRHERYTLNALERFVLLRLDGAHTPGQITDELPAGPFAGGELELADGEVVTDPEAVYAKLRQGVEAVLFTFLALPLLTE